MRPPVPPGKINFRLWSDDVPLREHTREIGLVPKIIHDKGGAVMLGNGRPRATKSPGHYISYQGVDLQNPAQASAHIGGVLDALANTQMAKLIGSGAVEAAFDLAAFHGEIAWEDELDPALVAAAKAANVRIVIEHYDKFTDSGAPLAVQL